MRLFCAIPAIMLAIALTLGGGYAPMPSMAEAGMADSGKAGAPDQATAMPDCPMCVPDDPIGPGCSPGCPVPAAILPLGAIVPVVTATLRQMGSPFRRLADADGTPEPPPPKPTLLA